MTLDELITSFQFAPCGGKKPRYYGIQVPGRTEENPIVLQQLPDPRKFLATCPGVRFKEFTSHEEAEAYSRFQFPVVADVNFKRALEPRSPFPSPSQAEKDQLLSAVSGGDCATVRRLAWKNPRLLLTPDDSPQTYRGTWRHTVLHLAVQAQNFDLFCTILEVIEDPAFASVTQLTEFENLDERRSVIVRNYLNNRTKKEESVLDFAVMFGVVKIMDFLTVHPLCDLATPRKSGQSLPSITCSKCTSANRKELSSAILSMLEGRWYVPLYSPSEIFEKAQVGEAVHAASMREALKEGKLAGFFGPMTESDSRNLSVVWKTSLRGHARSRSRSRTVPDSDGTLEDSEPESLEETLCQSRIERKSRKTELMALKRTEEACRALAKQKKILWKEWWRFLGIFVDISSLAGLCQLESFLADESSDSVVHEDSTDRWAKPPCIVDNLTVVELLSTSYTRTQRSIRPALSSQTNLDVDGGDDVFYTPPSSPEPTDTALRNFSVRYAKRNVLFINGRKPGFSDYEVWDALQREEIPDDFRYILAWRDQMEQEMQSEKLTDAMTRMFL